MSGDEPSDDARENAPDDGWLQTGSDDDSVPNAPAGPDEGAVDPSEPMNPA